MTGKSSKISKTTDILPFLRALLDDASHVDIICWTDASKKQFKLVDSKRVAVLWGVTTNRSTTYDAMSRKLRHLCTQKRLLKIRGVFFEWRFLDSESAVVPESSDLSNVVMEALYNAITLVTPSEESKENQASSSCFRWKIEPSEFANKSSRLSRIVASLADKTENS